MTEKTKEVKSVETAAEVRDIAVKFVREHKRELNTIKVRTRPINGSAIQVTFKGYLTEEYKDCIRRFVLGDLKVEVTNLLKKRLGWKKIRITRCTRDKSVSDYCWFIENRGNR